MEPFTIASLSLQLLPVVLKALPAVIGAFAQALGVTRSGDPVRLGDKALQAEAAGIVPEKYADFAEYLRAVEDFPLEPDASLSFSEEEKSFRGALLCVQAIRERFPLQPVCELLNVYGRFPMLWSVKTVLVLAEFVLKEPEIVSDIVTYLGGGQMSDESIDRAVNVICAMLKADDPSLSDADADVKALRMRV